MDSGQSAPALAAACAFLRTLLADGPVAAREVQCEAQAAGIAKRTLERAKAALGVQSRRQGGAGAGGHWAWELPKDANTTHIGGAGTLSSAGRKPCEGGCGRRIPATRRLCSDCAVVAALRLLAAGRLRWHP